MTTSPTLTMLLPDNVERGSALKKMECTVCGYVYDPVEGMPEHGVPGGVAFEDLPEDFTCPVCGVGKELFVPLEA